MPSNTRIDNLQTNSFITELNDDKEFMRELKNRQFSAGSHNIVTYYNTSPNQYDIASIIDNDFLITFSLEFTSSNQDYAFLKPVLEIWVDSITPENKLTNTYAIQSSDLINGIGWGSISQLPATTIDGLILNGDVIYGDNPRLVTWTFTLATSGTTTVYIKASVAGTAKGSIKLRREYPTVYEVTY